MSGQNYSIGGTGHVPEASTMVNPVAGTKLLMRRSDTQGKKPAAGDAEYGELFVNYHSNSPMLCFKNNADTIVEIRPLTEVELALGELTDVDTTGATNGMVLSYNGSTWIPVSAASIAIDVDLGYTPAADKGTVTNSAGDDATIPLATGTNAGLSLNNYTTAEKDKLAGIEDGAEANVVTSVHGRTGDVVAAEGDYDLSQMGDVDTSGATTGQLLRYNGSSWEPGSPGAVSVDLGYTPAADKGTVTNDAGSNAEIPLVTDTNAGLMAPGDKNKIDGYPASPDDIPGTLDLQAVTDNGNTTTNGAGFGGDVIVGSEPGIGNNIGTRSSKQGFYDVSRTSGGAVFNVYKTGDAAKQIELKSDGSGMFAAGNITLSADGKVEFAGGVANGSVTTPEQTVTSGAFDLSAGPYWLIPGSIDVPDPTNAVAGMSGLIRFTAAPTSWGSAFQFAGGTPVAPSKLPAISPFYVQASGSIYVGPAVEELI